MALIIDGFGRVTLFWCEAMVSIRFLSERILLTCSWGGARITLEQQLQNNENARRTIKRQQKWGFSIKLVSIKPVSRERVWEASYWKMIWFKWNLQALLRFYAGSDAFAVWARRDAKLQLSGHLDNDMPHREGGSSSGCFLEFTLNYMHGFSWGILKYLLRSLLQVKQTHTHMKSSFRQKKVSWLLKSGINSSQRRIQIATKEAWLKVSIMSFISFTTVIYLWASYIKTRSSAPNATRLNLKISH